MNGTFSEQLGGVTGIFDQWGACERTVVACTLARRVGWPGLRLVQRAVEAALGAHVPDELLERDANDEALLATLLAAAPEHDDNDGNDCLHRLLTLLPLLRTDNERAKDVYVAATPALVQRCIDAPRLTSTPDLCRQLLTYLLVHPALTVHDQRTLTDWLRYLENHISGQRNPDSMWQQQIDPGLLVRDNIWGANNTFRRTIGKNVEFRTIIDNVDQGPYTTDLLQESFSKNGRDVDISLEGDKLNFDAAIAQPKQRSNSLTPPSSHFIHMSSSAENLNDEPFQKPRSFSLSSEHSLSQLRPLSGAYTTGSETRLDDLRTNNFTEHPGMAMVGPWLKSLRLHKYVWLFTNISYDQMMAIDEKYLEKLGVTKGARHKLLLSIKKLSDRASVISSVEAEFSSGVGPAAAARALERLRAALLAPMPPRSELPRMIVSALYTASKCISVSSSSSTEGDLPDPMSLHCWLIEKALHHSMFSCPSLQSSLRRLRHRLPPLQFYHHVSDTPHHHHRWRVSGHNGYKTAARRSWQWSAPAPPAPPARPKSHSYPPGAAPRPPPPRAAPAPAHDYSSLDALCLQMTEQAIN